MSVCICPGSFDPITNGHLDVIRSASRLFDRVVVAVLDSAAKTYMFTREQRLAMAAESVAEMPGVKAAAYDGLLVDLMHELHIEVIVRGIRSGADLDLEMQSAQVNRLLMPQAQTIFLPAHGPYAGISSTVVRELIRFHGDISALVPGCVQAMIGNIERSDEAGRPIQR